MHRNDGPGDHAAAVHLQILTGGQLDLRSILQKLLLHSVVKFLPAVVRKGSDIVENQVVVLCVEFLRSLRRSRAPSRAKVVDELAEVGFVGGLLLRPGPNESQQCTDYGQPHIQQPSPSLGIFVASTVHGCGHSVSPRECGLGMSQSVSHNLFPLAGFCKSSYLILFDFALISVHL